MSFDRWQNRRWYVAHTRPAKEAVAVAHLDRQGFRSFFPQVARTVRHARRAHRVLRPLFPRYVFVALDLNVDRWRAVRGTIGVSTLIMDGDRPRPAPAGLVEGMMACSPGEDGFVLRTELALGGRVRFLTGPFEDRLGRLVELGDSERVTVLLEILGAEREVVVASGQLLSAER